LIAFYPDCRAQTSLSCPAKRCVGDDGSPFVARFPHPGTHPVRGYYCACLNVAEMESTSEIVIVHVCQQTCFSKKNTCVVLARESYGRTRPSVIVWLYQNDLALGQTSSVQTSIFSLGGDDLSARFCLKRSCGYEKPTSRIQSVCDCVPVSIHGLGRGRGHLFLSDSSCRVRTSHATHGTDCRESVNDYRPDRPGRLHQMHALHADLPLRNSAGHRLDGLDPSLLRFPDLGGFRHLVYAASLLLHDRLQSSDNVST
jgi:hypothetical protein